MYVYKEGERFTDDDGTVYVLYTVGFYAPDDEFISDSDHSDREEAAKRVNFLNGGYPLAFQLLLKACETFVRKCESGEAISKRSYREMKEAIGVAYGRIPEGGG